MKKCDHIGYRRYARRVFANGTTHVCVQCAHCLGVVKLPEHGDRPFIRLDEVPPGKALVDWIDPDGVQGELI